MARAWTPGLGPGPGRDRGGRSGGRSCRRLQPQRRHRVRGTAREPQATCPGARARPAGSRPARDDVADPGGRHGSRGRNSARDRTARLVEFPALPAGCVRDLRSTLGEDPEGDMFGRAARRFEELGVGAILINCLPTDHVPGMLPWLRDFTDLPLGVYPNSGHRSAGSWRFDDAVSPGAFGELAAAWRAEGAQIVGGCCGTSPQHSSAAARTRLAGTRAGRSGSPTDVGPARTGPIVAESLRTGPDVRVVDGRGRTVALPAPIPGSRARTRRIPAHDGQPPRVDLSVQHRSGARQIVRRRRVRLGVQAISVWHSTGRNRCTPSTWSPARSRARWPTPTAMAWPKG